MKPLRSILCCCLCFSGNIFAQSNNGYFKFHLQPGQQTGTVFMRTISIAGENFPELVSRVSGTGDYTVERANADSAAFTAIFRVDGHPASELHLTISDQGRMIAFSGKRSANHEGSGLAYNAFLWGIPPANLKPGDSWNVQLTDTWESGGPGLQKVTVIATDPKNHTIYLRRDGESGGYYENEPRELTISKDGKALKVTLNPGKTRWTGYTLFKEGLILSDELMAERPVSLTAADGSIYTAQQREYMMLSAKPFEAK